MISQVPETGKMPTELGRGNGPNLLSDKGREFAENIASSEFSALLDGAFGEQAAGLKNSLPQAEKLTSRAPDSDPVVPAGPGKKLPPVGDVLPLPKTGSGSSDEIKPDFEMPVSREPLRTAMAGKPVSEFDRPETTQGSRTASTETAVETSETGGEAELDTTLVPAAAEFSIDTDSRDDPLPDAVTQLRSDLRLSPAMTGRPVKFEIADTETGPDQVNRASTNRRAITAAETGASRLSQSPYSSPGRFMSAEPLQAAEHSAEPAARTMILPPDQGQSSATSQSAPPQQQLSSLSGSLVTTSSASVDLAAGIRTSPSAEKAAEQITSARELDRNLRPEISVRNSDFGSVNMRLDTSGADLRATLTARDPAFISAVQSILGDRAQSPETGVVSPAAARASEIVSAASSQNPSGTGSGTPGQSDGRYGSSPGSDQGQSQPYKDQREGQDKSRSSPQSHFSDGAPEDRTESGALFA